MNAVSLKLGTRAGVFLTLLKLLALVAVAIMGLVQLGKGKASDSLRGNIFEGSSSSPGRYALALYSGLWAYDGWDQCCYVAGEMKNVSRDLPRAIHISVPLVIVMFLAANICEWRTTGISTSGALRSAAEDSHCVCV
jgi:amino acid transporter